MERIESFDGCRIAVRSDRASTKPAALMSHHLGGSHAVFDALSAALSDRFRVIRYDTRGQGASEAAEGPYDVAMLGRDALAVLDALGLQRASFVGVSQGGMTGMWLAANHPDRIERLVLANTTPFIPNKSVWDELIAKAAAQGMEAIAETTITGWLSDGFKARSPAGAEAAIAVMRAMSPIGYAGNCAVLRDVDLREALLRIGSPTLVIGGAEDGPRGASAPVMAQAIPDARLVIIAGAAHLPVIENPDDFNAAVSEFLR